MDRETMIRNLIDVGYDPKSVEDAVRADDTGRLIHLGRLVVRLLPPRRQRPA